jgi:hypothetical protein
VVCFLLNRSGDFYEHRQVSFRAADGSSSAAGFRKGVKQYAESCKTVSFSYLDQFLCMAFAQLTYRESLRDIEACLRAHKTKLYHLGIRGGVVLSTLADANETRD